MLAALACVACDKVPLTAPTGSTVTLFVNTTILPVNGTAEVTATVLESSGTFVQNGTVVNFTTTLGTLDPAEARTNNGKATVRLHAGTRSGRATIRAVSGSASSSTDEGAAVTVDIGGAAAGRIALNASPTTVSSAGGTSALTALVFDTAGNRLEGVPVSFSTTAGSLASSGAVTDANGEARNSVTTSRTATITAQVGGASGDGSVSATVEITAVALPTVGVTASPAAPFAGQTVTFAITATAADGTSIRSVTIDYGDGRIDTSGPISSASHVYNSEGTYRVTVSAEDSNGGRNSGSTTIVVSPAAPPLVALTASPSTVNPGEIVTFTVAVTPQGGQPAIVQSITYDFGDGNVDSNVGSLTRTHIYGTSGNFGASARVRFTDGNSQTATAAVRVR
jgi:hypothetical protein